ncbi:MAG: CgeB family protein [Agriterribacter sp.]
MKVYKILFVGSSSKSSLESSYANAAKDLRIEFLIFDPVIEQQRYIKGWQIGRKIHEVLPVEQWIRKMNRDFILEAKRFKPDCILLFANAKVLTGTLACIKTMLQAVKIGWIWPDTPLNLDTNTLLNASLLDSCFTYSSASVPVFKSLNFKNVTWVPLGGDPFLHKMEQNSGHFTCDISFVGGWRPEREKIMSLICRHFSNKNIDISIYGPLWKDKSTDMGIKKSIKGGGLYGHELAKVFSLSRINMNIIDDTNFPSANMRFFEIPTSFGLQVSSPCPEQENIFKHKEHILYFQSDEDLISQLEWILSHEQECDQIRYNANALLMKEHTYTNRLYHILKSISQ